VYIMPFAIFSMGIYSATGFINIAEESVLSAFAILRTESINDLKRFFSGSSFISMSLNSAGKSSIFWRFIFIEVEFPRLFCFFLRQNDWILFRRSPQRRLCGGFSNI